MRIQEHLFQGFFGLKTKKDSAKYYHERVEQLRGLDNDLDNCIQEFQNILKNHKIKIEEYDRFLGSMDMRDFEKVRSEIMKLEGMFDDDEVSNESNKRYVTKMENIITELLKNEENSELTIVENDTSLDLKELMRMMVNIQPVWQRQLEFVESHAKIDRGAIAELTAIFKQESDILKMEEALLRRIDLKTGNLLRKTTLKMRDLEKTTDMNMQYREIKHIR